MTAWKTMVGAGLIALACGAFAAEPEPELQGNCAMSAAVGSKLPTTCSVVWISPQDKLYCFSSEMAKQAFLKDPAGNELRAQTFWKDPSLWERLKKEQPEG
jgi:hypothetical protein